MKILSPKLDIVFQNIFGKEGNESITKDLLEAILESKIEKLDLSKNPILKRENKDDKLGVLDVIAELDDKKVCNIELQVVDQKNIIERLLFYWSKLYTKQIKIGDDYSVAKKAVVILIADFKIKGLEELDYVSKWKIIDMTNRQKILTDKFEIDIIELPKTEGKEKEEGKLMDWLMFLENPNSERVNKIVNKNNEIKKAKEELKKISNDEKMQRLADWREKYIIDQNSAIHSGIVEGKEIGLRIGKEEGIREGREEGIKEGREEGIKEGREEGIKEGREEGIKEVAKKLLKKGLKIEEIAEITELTVEEIKKLQ